MLSFTPGRATQGAQYAGMLTAPSAQIPNADTVAFQVPFTPAQLKVGNVLRLRASFRKSGTTDAGAFNVRLGPNGTVADTLIAGGASSLTTANVSSTIAIDFLITDSTHVLSLGNNINTNVMGYSGVTTIAAAAAVAITDIANALFFSVTISSSGATNTVSLAGAQLEVVSGN